MSQDESQLSDADWYLLKIQEAKSMDRLNYLADNIKYDTWEKSEYTQDAQTMQKIRNAWMDKKKQIESKRSK